MQNFGPMAVWSVWVHPLIIIRDGLNVLQKLENNSRCDSAWSNGCQYRSFKYLAKLDNNTNSCSSQIKQLLSDYLTRLLNEILHVLLIPMQYSCVAIISEHYSVFCFLWSDAEYL